MSLTLSLPYSRRDPGVGELPGRIALVYVGLAGERLVADALDVYPFGTLHRSELPASSC